MNQLYCFGLLHWHWNVLQYAFSPLDATKSETPYLQVVSGAAVGAVALDLEGALKGERDPEARGHHHVPEAVLSRQVALRVAGAAQHAAVCVQEASTTWRGRRNPHHYHLKFLNNEEVPYK